MLKPTRNALLIAPLVLFALALSPAAGCDKITGPTEEEQKIAEEQAAIRAYSERIPAVDKLQDKFTERWRQANELKDIKAFKEALTSSVIPALEEYVAAIGEIPLGSKRLEEIHSIMTEAYGGTVEAFSKFVDGLAEDNLSDRYKAFMERMDAVVAADKEYRTKLAEYYEENRVRLVDKAGK